VKNGKLWYLFLFGVAGGMNLLHLKFLSVWDRTPFIHLYEMLWLEFAFIESFTSEVVMNAAVAFLDIL
jgi:hypothetical protein